MIRYRSLIALPALLALALAGVACSSTSNGSGERGDAAEADMPTAEDLATLAEAETAIRDKAQWRRVHLPELLEMFGTPSHETWGQARSQLLRSPHTPSQRRTGDPDEGDGIESSYIHARLQADDWNTDRSRSWMVRQARIIRLLAQFDSTNRADWTAARKELLAMTEADEAELQRRAEAHLPDDRPDYEREEVTPAERCAFELVLRLLIPPDRQDASSSADRFDYTQPAPGSVEHGRLFNTRRPDNADWADTAPTLGGPQHLILQDRALWAVEELVELGGYALNPVLLATRMTDAAVRAGNMDDSSPESVRFQELLWMTLSRMDELPVPALLIELENAMQLDDEHYRFQRVRRLVHTLGEIYGPETFATPERIDREDGSAPDYVIRRIRSRPDWQRDPEHRDDVIATITNVVREYRSDNEWLRFQIRNYGIEAFRQMGDASACPALVDLWEAVRNEDDEFLIELIEEALRDLSGRPLRGLREWRAFVDSQ